MHRLLLKYLVHTIAAAHIAACAMYCAAFEIVGQNRFELNDQQFNSWVFNGNGTSIDSDAELSVTVEAVDRSCHLNPEQQEKLLLAGRGDYARFTQRVDELRAQYVGKNYDQNDVGEIFQKIQPLNATYQAGLLGQSSLFSKVLHRTLTPEQLQEYEEAQVERMRVRHAAKVRLFVAIYERSCPLTAKQRAALLEVLLAETRSPKRSSQFDWYVVLLQAARIPNEKFASFMDESQMRMFKKSTQQARELEPHLKQQGVLPDP